MTEKILIVDDEPPEMPRHCRFCFQLHAGDCPEPQPTYKAPAPRDASLVQTRAERRRLARGKGDVPGTLVCKFCMSTRGTYHSYGNHFNCHTVGCKGNKGAF